MQLVLASSSPRRLGLLKDLGLSFLQVTPDIDESVRSGESPYEYVARLAGEKAQAGTKLGLSALGDAVEKSNVVVVAADTVVVVEGKILGKPGSKKEGIRMLESLSNRKHIVLTGLSVCSQESENTQVVSSEVCFRALAGDEIEQYWQTGEPQDKAGGYGIQGIGAVFVRRIEGSYSNVVGLPVAELHIELRKFGINCLAQEIDATHTDLHAGKDSQHG